MARTLDDAGISVYINRALASKRMARLSWLAGLGDQLAYCRGTGSAATTSPGSMICGYAFSRSGMMRAVILMAHEPDAFFDVSERIALTLSGHNTHAVSSICSAGAHSRQQMGQSVIPPGFTARSRAISLCPRPWMFGLAAAYRLMAGNSLDRIGVTDVGKRIRIRDQTEEDLSDADSLGSAFAMAMFGPSRTHESFWTFPGGGAENRRDLGRDAVSRDDRGDRNGG